MRKTVSSGKLNRKGLLHSMICLNKPVGNCVREFPEGTEMSTTKPSIPVFLNPNYPATRIFEEKIPRPTTEVFDHLHVFLKASFISLSTKKLYNSKFLLSPRPVRNPPRPVG